MLLLRKIAMDSRFRGNDDIWWEWMHSIGCGRR